MHKVKLLDYGTRFSNYDKFLLTSDMNLLKPEVPIVHSTLFSNNIPDNNLLGVAHLVFENLVLFAYCDFDTSVVVYNSEYPQNRTIGMISKTGCNLTYESFSICMNALDFHKSEDSKKRFGGSIVSISPVISLANPGCHEPFILTDSFDRLSIERSKRIILFTPLKIDPSLFMKDLYPDGYFDRGE